MVEIKERAHASAEAFRNAQYETSSLVIGIFTAFFDVHIYRIPYPGRLIT